MPAQAFLTALESNLQFWWEQVSQVKNNQYKPLTPDRENIFQAVNIGFNFPETQGQALDLALNLYDLVETEAYWLEWLPILERGCSLEGKSTAQQIRLLNQLGFLNFLLSRSEQALRYYQKAETIAVAYADPYWIANTAFGFCNVYNQIHQYEEAEKQGHMALKFFLEAKAPQEKIIVTHNILGWIYRNIGKFELSEKHHTHAVELARETQKPGLLARMLVNLAANLQKDQQFLHAEAYFQEALALVREEDSSYFRFSIINYLGINYFDQGNYFEAEKHFLTLEVSYLRQHGHRFMLASRYNNLGNVYLKTRRFEEAEKALHSAAEIWRNLQDGVQLGNTLGDLGEAVENQKRLEEALPIYEEALQWLEKNSQNAWARDLFQRIGIKRERVLEHISPTADVVQSN